MRYWSTHVLQLFVNQVVMSWILKLTLFSNQAAFSIRPKSHDKNLNILGTKKAFKMKQKAFFIIFKGLSMKQFTQIFFGAVPDFKEHVSKTSSDPCYLIHNYSFLILHKKKFTLEFGLLHLLLSHFQSCYTLSSCKHGRDWKRAKVWSKIFLQKLQKYENCGMLRK